MNIALVHEFLVTWGGSDLVARTFCDIYPGAPLYTALYDPAVMDKHFAGVDVRVSSLNKYPLALKKHRLYMPMFPLVFEQFDLRGYDIVLSSHHMAAKGVLTSADTCHVCFVHTPMRYAWDFYHEYIEEFNPLLRPVARRLLHHLRIWDVAAANRVDFFISNAHNVARRIRKHYRRDSTVIHSPIDAQRFHIANKVGDYYLAVSRLVPYKRTDLAVQAFTKLGEKLVVAGSGPEMKRLKAMAGPNIEFLGFVPDADLPALYAGCRAFVFPANEDFGLTPLEAQAAGRPVIAYGAGGALETVVPGRTGVFFPEQTPDSLEQAVKALDWQAFDPQEVRRHALQFDVSVFKKKIANFIEEKFARWKEEAKPRS